MPSFVALAIDDPAALSPARGSAFIEIALRRGRAVRVPPGFDAETLQRVVDATIT